jgi:copper chaperone CopZ
MTTQVAPVRGMHCAACVGRVERALTGLAGVERATVNLATEQATVSFDPERTSFDALQAAVAAAGYELVRPLPDAAPGAALDTEQAARPSSSVRRPSSSSVPYCRRLCFWAACPTSCRGCRRRSRTRGSS